MLPRQASIRPRQSLGRLTVPAGTRAAGPRRAAVVRVVNGDGAARVKGDVQRVFMYVSNFEAWRSWYPGVASVTRISGMGAPCATRGTRFVMEQNIAGWKNLTTYEVADVEEYRRVVYSGASKMHLTTDQFILMPDPNDPSFTFVRYMSTIQLKGGAAALLQPMVSGMLAKIPEEAMANLSKLLCGANTPLASIRLPPKQDTRQKQQSAEAKKASPSSGSASQKSAPGKGAQDKLFQSLGNLWNSMGSTASASSSMDERTKDEELSAQLDPKRYYRSLGLNPASRDTLGPDDVKAAFRKMAQTMHPDKAVGVSGTSKTAAEDAFRAVQEAYEVLRDPDTKRAYDEGKVMGSASTSTAKSR